MTDSMKLERILARVSKPARYTGGELNEIHKQTGDGITRLALCFPDVYEVGMSHLGSSILYQLINSLDNVFAERCFAPWPDMEQALREEDLPLFSLETRTPLSRFDIVGFSLGYEMGYTNILCMLDLGDIPLLSKDRNDQTPLVIAGGGCVYNPEPIADFIDVFVIGEGEEVLPELISLYQQCGSRSVFLQKAATIEGLYVPALYDIVYNDDATIKYVSPQAGAPSKIKKRIVKDFDKSFFPLAPIVPYLGIVHDRISLELMRGCTRGCRFCQAGFVYRPLRERSQERLITQAQACITQTGHEEVSLCSLSTGDYSNVAQLVCTLSDTLSSQGVSLAIPSLRVDSYEGEYAQRLKQVRNTGLTFAPEAGTQRLRDIINKNLTEDMILGTVKEAFESGTNGVKLYFMIGLPDETIEDVLGIAELAARIREIYYQVPKENRGGGFRLTVSVSCFVPKPHTPFQWDGQDSIVSFEHKQQLLKNALRPIRGVKYNWHDAKLSFLEAAFSRGDRRLGGALHNAYRLGCRFDSWKEHFDYGKWQAAFDKAGIDPAFYASRERSFDETLPWDIIDTGILKAHLWREKQRANSSETTPDCRAVCSGCGQKQAGLCL